MKSSITSLTNSTSKYTHQSPSPQPPPPPASFLSTIPLATITPESQREISEITTTTCTPQQQNHHRRRQRRQQRGKGNSIENQRGTTRPGHGIFLFLLLLLTILGIILWSIPQTRRRIGVFIYLPIYIACLLGYILFLCLVAERAKDDCLQEDQQDEWHECAPQPWALRDYLGKKKKKKKKRRQAMTTRSSTRRMMKGKKKHSSSTIKGKEKDIEVEEKKDLDLNTTARTEDSFPAESSDDTFSGGDYDMDMFQDDSLEEIEGLQHEENFVLVDMFQTAFPKLSQTLEAFEGHLYFFTAKIRHAMAPPHQCYECRDGVPSTSSVMEDVIVHQGHGHGHESVEFQPPLTDVENYFVQQVGEYPSFSRVDLSGKYKLMHNYNFDAFLKSQNVPMLIRKAANSSRPVHTITHEGDRLRIQVDGITKGDTTYVINGPPSGSNIRHLKFDDYVTWVDDGQAVQVRKVAKNAPPNGAVELIVKRQLANHGHNLILTSKAKFEDGSESVESVQTFHRIH